ncbi:hypothetical protein AAFF_G00241480 [Aldrovandia affinis]|uniref:RRM domain-containing protein n=1 Tax=Aldrovandia affinis TaxID=143900 RepID=A0AAD7SUN7_9TELE|nr:hypothetical protein AAFF_G00241480 [Aldrovandia affinis]
MAAPTKKAFDVFVNKIPWTVATKEMKEYFAQFGQIKRLVLPFDRETGFNRGFCRVSYSTEEGMQNALQKETHVVEGSRLQVQKDRRPSVDKRLGGERDDS